MRLNEFNSSIWGNIRKNRDYLEKLICQVSNHSVIVGSDLERLPNTTYVITKGWKGDLQVALLDLDGFAISSGSACSSVKKAQKSSIMSMGYSSEESECGIRLSIGPSTTREEINRFVGCWSKHLQNWIRKVA